jgi:formamidopyrimidine-DNA glycosylase
VPELPEVEAVRRLLEPVMAGARIVAVVARRPDLRRPLPARFVERLEGQRVTRVGRRGKYLTVDLSSDEVLVMHLGMSGSFRIVIERDERDESAGPFVWARGNAGVHDHVLMHLSSGATVIYNDPRRFGVMDLVSRGDMDRYPPLAGLGPEPLDPHFGAAQLARAVAGRKAPLKAALLDQRVVAGLGNIYAVEALHRARLSPRRRASTLATRAGAPTPAAVRLAGAITRVLNEAVAQSLAWQRAEPTAREDAAYFPHRFRVYDREGARCRTARCPGRIRRVVQSGRSSYYCPVCQR